MWGSMGCWKQKVNETNVKREESMIAYTSIDKDVTPIPLPSRIRRKPDRFDYVCTENLQNDN